MTGLVEFLRARADEDESEARAMIEGAPPGYGKASGGAPRNPHRVLAEVDAKRRIIDACSGDEPGTTYYLDNPDVVDGLNLRVLHLLALPHADHPDYRPEWRP